MNFDLDRYLTELRQTVNQELNRIIERCVHEERLRQAVSYSINAGGKRLRPILCMASTEAVGGDPADALRTGCAIELIHTYSLIHDDLPAIDNDTMRRGQPSCHIAFDEATAIFAGDALQALAFEVLSSEDHRIKDDSKRLKIIEMIARAAGADGLAGGQMKDIMAQGVKLSSDRLCELHLMKTGALIRASVLAGGIIGGGDGKQMEDLAKYAENIGLAFQVTDDLLDVNGDPALMGKAAGVDSALGKATYPGILGIEASKELAANLVKNGLKALDSFDIKAEPLRAIARYVAQRTH